MQKRNTSQNGGIFSKAMYLNEVILVVMGIILQCNARSIFSNGAEFKKVINDISPDIICVQETFLSSKYSFRVANYNAFRRESQIAMVEL